MLTTSLASFVFDANSIYLFYLLCRMLTTTLASFMIDANHTANGCVLMCEMERHDLNSWGQCCAVSLMYAQKRLSRRRKEPEKLFGPKRFLRPPAALGFLSTRAFGRLSEQERFHHRHHVRYRSRKLMFGRI